MKEIFNFFSRFHTFILFLVFEVISISLLVQNSVYQRAVFINSSSILVGNIYNSVNYITEYLSLKKTNDLLLQENARLYNQSYKWQKELSTDTVHVNDTINKQQFFYIPAKVINNAVNHQNNYITINRGLHDGIKPEMAVISSSGVVGVVKNVSTNFSTVIPILNSNFKVSGKIKKNGYFGSVAWNGNDYSRGNLYEIPLHVDVMYGDTVVTTGYSVIFPEGIPIGTIVWYDKKSGNNFYDISLRFSTDFKSLQTVFVVGNLRKEEIQKLEASSVND